MRFRDIPQLTSPCSYSVNVGWRFLEKWLADTHPHTVIEPDFQRHHVWDDERRSRYVEFCLRGGHWSRDLFWNCATWNRVESREEPLELVDGLQRLTAVRMFMADGLRVFDHLYSQFEDELRWTKQDFRMNVNDLETRAQVLRWYLEINEGGVAHAPGELERVRALLEAES